MTNNPPDKSRMVVNPPVFYISAGLIIAFVLFGAGFTETAGITFSAAQTWVTTTFGWFYLLSVAVFLLFSIYLALSSYGGIKLGPDDSEPDYSYGSWFAMLFSAGMGIGLLFFGVAEPIMHFNEPPTGEGGTIPAARAAMSLTFFHWGLHAWAIYAVVGLSLAYFSFRHNLPLTIRSALYPLIGERIHGPIGHAVDIFAVIGTMFGIATSLGLGVMQINAGLNHLLQFPENLLVQILLIGGITLIATGSVVAGLDAGIKRISELNLILAVALLAFMLFAGPTLFLLETLVQNTGMYLGDIVSRTFHLYAYDPQGWIGGWTLFYWGWWIAWSPFVGMFIARISRGRTIREFILGVLCVPVGFTFMWMTFFGNSAIYLELFEQSGLISTAVDENVATSLFTLLGQMPFSMLASGIATLLVITFFVTSSDSGSLVIDIITSGGREDSPVWQRVFWALAEGVVAAVLLLAGGLSALQAASIVGALPFTFVMLLVCYGLLRGLQMEGAKRLAYGIHPATLPTAEPLPWRQRIKAIVTYPGKEAVENFLHSTVFEALAAVAEELRKNGLEVELVRGEEYVSLNVFHDREPDFVYTVAMRAYIMPSFAFTAYETHPERQHKYYRVEAHLSAGCQHYDLMDYTRDQLINDILAQYERHMQFLHLAR